MTGPSNGVGVFDQAVVPARPTIGIDGATYEILSPHELTAEDEAYFRNEGGHFDRLCALPELTDAGKRRLGELLVELSDRIMVGVPAEVRAKMTDTQRLMICRAFDSLNARARREGKRHG